PRLDPEVRVRTRLAKQNLPALRLLRGDAERQPVGVADLAGQQPGATRAAVAGLAAVREIEAGAESCFEHRLSRSDAQRPPVRLAPPLPAPAESHPGPAPAPTLPPLPAGAARPGAARPRRRPPPAPARAAGRLRRHTPTPTRSARRKTSTMTTRSSPPNTTSS